MKTFKKIVVGTDFSDSSINAFHFAQQMAKQFGATIQVVNFFEIPPNGANPNYLELMPTFDELEHASKERLARFINEKTGGTTTATVANGIKITTKSQAGFAADGLVDLTKDPSVDLLVLGATGEHGWIDKIFGSIAVKVSENAHCPVLLVPQKAEYAGMKDFVYASSFDSAQPREIKTVLDLAKYFSAAVHFVHVITKPDDLGISEKLLFSHLVGQEKTQVPFSIENTRAATPVEGINQYILNHSVDLLVTVTRHRNFWEKMRHSSVSVSLAWRAYLPLLILHLDEKAPPPV